MSNPQNLSNNKNLSEFIKQQRENELDQMERLEDMQEQAQANALKQIEENSTRNKLKRQSSKEPKIKSILRQISLKKALRITP